MTMRKIKVSWDSYEAALQQLTWEARALAEKFSPDDIISTPQTMDEKADFRQSRFNLKEKVNLLTAPSHPQGLAHICELMAVVYEMKCQLEFEECGK